MNIWLIKGDQKQLTKVNGKVIKKMDKESSKSLLKDIECKKYLFTKDLSKLIRWKDREHFRFIKNLKIVKEDKKKNL